jgi:hypothetical protein
MTIHARETGSRRPRWLLPVLVAAAAGLGLAILGIVPVSTLLSVAVFGGMIVMHLGGHGSHGGHSGHESHALDVDAPESPSDKPASGGGCH